MDFCVCLLLQDQWGHVEEIELVNDGSGLGFGIVGGKMTGVVVRTIVPNSVADRVSPTQSGQNIVEYYVWTWRWNICSQRPIKHWNSYINTDVLKLVFL